MKDQPERGASVSKEIDELFQRAQAGDAAAAQALFDRYAEKFRAVIRGKLAGRLRSLFDSDDFPQEGRLKLFEKELQIACRGPAHFVALMGKVLERGVLQRNRQFLDYPSRNLNRERPLARLAASEEPCQRPAGGAQHPMDSEAWDAFLLTQPPHYQRILNMLREGYSREETSRQLEVPAWKVHVCVAKLRHVSARHLG